MSRKVQMRRIWREGHRRSPRISALEAWKARLQQPPRPPFTKTNRTSSTGANNNCTVISNTLRCHQPSTAVEGPSSGTRAKKRRKLRPLQDVSSSTPKAAAQDVKKNDEQDSRKPDQSILNNNKNSEDKATYQDQPSFASCMPEKRILELVIDLLQRRDTREIFAEPVDPSEVEAYYEIIKEPMDFGTMRAKLHEGMYKNLEQLEHDVFLITRNAMHFNSSATVYFRQALAIDKLAKKIFHHLRTDPENFEYNFLETRRRRRRSSSRLPSKGRVSPHNSGPNLATSSKTSDMKLSVLPKLDPPSTKGSSNLKRAIQEKIGYYGINILSDKQDHELLHGGADGKPTNSSAADKRSIYKPWDPLLSMYHPIVGSSKELILVMQQNITYRESLKLFVKDLGPTAQMIAKKKLNEWSTEAGDFRSPNSNVVAATSSQWISTTTLHTAKFDADKGKRYYISNKVGTHDTSVGITANHNGVKGTTNHVTCHQNQKKDLNFSTAGLNETEKSKMDMRMPSASPLNLRSTDNNMISPSSCPQTLAGTSSLNLNNQYGESNGHGQAMAAGGPRQGLGGMSERGEALKLMERLTPTSPYIFDLPFVKSRLDQTNSMGRRDIPGQQRPFLDGVNDNHRRSSFYSPCTNLALQF